jgi:hypothetical protein
MHQLLVTTTTFLIRRTDRDPLENYGSLTAGYIPEQTTLEVSTSKPSPRHPAKNAECYQGSRPLRPVGNVHYAGLTAPYDREQGHLMIWPP